MVRDGEVICDRWNQIIVKVNDKTTADYIDEAQSFTRGCLALQQFDRVTRVPNSARSRSRN